MIALGCELAHCVVWPETRVPRGSRYTGHILTPWGAFPVMPGNTSHADDSSP